MKGRTVDDFDEAKNSAELTRLRAEVETLKARNAELETNVQSQWDFIAAKTAELERVRANSYPNMCRMDHAQIGHGDSEREQCPLCIVINERDVANERVQEATARAEAAEAKVRYMEGEATPICGWPWENAYDDGYQTGQQDMRDERDSALNRTEKAEGPL